MASIELDVALYGCGCVYDCVCVCECEAHNVKCFCIVATGLKSTIYKLPIDHLSLTSIQARCLTSFVHSPPHGHTQAISVTIATFITEPLKHIGQGIGEFLRALLQDLPITLQIPVLLTIVFSILVWCSLSCYGALCPVMGALCPGMGALCPGMGLSVLVWGSLSWYGALCPGMGLSVLVWGSLSLVWGSLSWYGALYPGMGLSILVWVV